MNDASVADTRRTNNEPPHRDAAGAARRYIANGLAVIPVPYRTKAPRLADWPSIRITEAQVAQHVASPTNVGVLNGEPSGGVVDVDLDCDEAVACAQRFLPPTGCIFGRASRPQSHFLYRVSSGVLPRTAKFDDVDGGKDRAKEDGAGADTALQARDRSTIVELRSTGSQTLFPPSCHPSGDEVRFESDGKIGSVDSAELVRRVTHLAVCVLLARHWPGCGTRHAVANAAAGFLLERGIDVESAVLIVETAAYLGTDEEWQARGADVRATAETLAKRHPATGAPTLGSLLGEKVVARLKKWVGPAPGGAARVASQAKHAAALVELASSAEYFRTPDDTPWASVPVGPHVECWPLAHRAYRRWLGREYYLATKSTPSAQALQDAVALLEARARYDGGLAPVFTRLGERDGAVYLDLANDAWEVVRITSSGWEVIDGRCIKFRRPAGIKPLPYPTRGGTVDELRRFINVANEDDWRLVVGWLMAALRPHGPFPILVVLGEQGSAKSTLVRVLRHLVDPSTVPLRRPPRNEHDLMIAAKNCGFRRS